MGFYRLESGTSTLRERLSAINELQNIARVEPEEVGLFALQKIMDILRRDDSSIEELQEALDLVEKLVARRSNSGAGKSNSELLLSDTSNIELLLDLLEHDDVITGVTAIKILTDLHLNDSVYLEKSIQQCPNGRMCPYLISSAF